METVEQAGGMMEEGLALVFSAPASAERETEFNEWYEKVHIPEVLAVDGFVSAQRYQLDPDQPRPPKPGTALAEQPYVTVYRLEADSLADVATSLRAAVPEMHMSDAICTDPPPKTVYYRLV